MIIDPSNALCGPGFLPGLRLPERRLTVNRRRRRRGAVARRGWGASQARAASGRPGRPGLRAPKWRPPRGAGRAPRAPGARPRGWSSCPPSPLCRPSSPSEPPGSCGGSEARWPPLGAGPRARAAVCGRGLPRVRCPCRRAVARARGVPRAGRASPPAVLRAAAAAAVGGGPVSRGACRAVRAARWRSEAGGRVVGVAVVGAPRFRSRPQVRRGDPLNLSILVSGGKETNEDSLSNGE